MISNQTSPPETLPTTAVIALSVPAVLIILLTVFGNLLVLFFKARVGRTNTTLLVWNLGLTDFLVGLFVLPIGAIYLIHRKWIFGRLMCRIWVGADVTFCTCSVVTICVISADRYLAVTRPLRYKSVITKCKIIIAIICIWAFSLGILLSTVRWDSSADQSMETDTCFAGHEIRYLAHSVVFAFFLPASVTLTLYWRIYRLARNRQRALNRGFLMILGRNMNFLTNTLSQTTALRVHVGKNNGMVEQQRRVLRTHERIAKTLGVVSCSFLFCWLPFFTLYLLNYRCEGCLPSLVIDIASWLGYCNSMLNPIIYSFTVKEFKRSALCAIVPLWNFVYRHCPKFVCKPPDPRASQRLARRKQQLSRLRTKTNNNNALLHPNYDFVKRKVPPRDRPKGAIASLMVNTNCSIAQNLLTSAAISRDERATGMETPMAVNLDISGSSASAISNGVKKQISKAEAGKINEMRRRGRRSTTDEHMKSPIEETEILNQNGLVTATLLLATTKKMYRGSWRKERREDPSSLPPSLSPAGSNDSSPGKTFRMPCRMSIKKRKRLSLPDTSAVLIRRELMTKGKTGGVGGEKGQQQLKGVLPHFRKKEARGNERKNSPSGLWQKATARAIALRDQFRMSKSSSFGSITSRKREKIEVEAAQEKTKEMAEEEMEAEARRNGEESLEKVAKPKASLDKGSWMFRSFEEEEPEAKCLGKNGEEDGEGEMGERKAENFDVQIIFMTEEVEL